MTVGTYRQICPPTPCLETFLGAITAREDCHQHLVSGGSWAAAPYPLRQRAPPQSQRMIQLKMPRAKVENPPWEKESQDLQTLWHHQKSQPLKKLKEELISSLLIQTLPPDISTPWRPWRPWQSQVVLLNTHKQNISWYSFFFFFFCLSPQHLEVPRPGSNMYHSSDPSRCSNTTRALTHCITRELHGILNKTPNLSAWILKDHNFWLCGETAED